MRACVYRGECVCVVSICVVLCNSNKREKGPADFVAQTNPIQSFTHGMGAT